MGIRVNKMLGYGLVDVATDGYTVVDERLNLEAPFWSYENPALSYAEWAEKRKDEDHALDLFFLRHHNIDSKDPRQVIAHGTEYMMPNVLCIRPVWMPDWHRHDDAIDWVEETYLKGDPNANCENWVEVLPHGIYPFNGSYMDDRTGARVKPDIMTWIRVMASSGSDAFPQQELDLLAQVGGFEDHAAALEHCVPLVPDEIRAVAEWADLFIEPTTWLQLRPMLYCWWS